MESVDDCLSIGGTARMVLDARDCEEFSFEKEFLRLETGERARGDVKGEFAREEAREAGSDWVTPP